MSDIFEVGPDLTLSHRGAKISRIPVLFQRHEPVQIMLLLRKTRRKLDRALNAHNEPETLVSLAKAVCSVADMSGRYAQVPTAPKPQLTGGKNIVRPILDIAGVTDA